MLFRTKQTNMSNKLNLPYFKTVLSKVYDYPTVFKKELDKAKKHLSEYDYDMLMHWLSINQYANLTLDL
ncbi:MAG: Uncharacterised protein [Bacteroidota bacterium]|nr:MAG: Uncharacterised protein [Bacteroidota bacterium]